MKRNIREVMHKQMSWPNYRLLLANMLTLSPWGIHTKPTQTAPLLPLGSVPHLWPVEHILHRQHGDNRQHLLAAPQMHRHDQHLTQHRLQGEFCHLQETCFRVFSEKSSVFSVQKKAMPLLAYLVSKDVRLTQNNFTQHKANYLSVFIIKRISNTNKKFLQINKCKLMNKEKH